MPYDRSMATHAPLPPEIWRRPPRAAQDFILALEARVASPVDGVAGSSPVTQGRPGRWCRWKTLT